MKTLLICHHDAPLHRLGLARWLASFSELVGIVEIHEPGRRLWQRIRREVRRVGPLRFLDVLAYNAYQRVFLAARDGAWQARELERLSAAYAPLPPGTPVLATPSPNSPDAAAFIAARGPDLVLAACKTLLQPEVFTLPAHGTFVVHPGICPEYRNAHGCFWALANEDDQNVGATLLKIDRGVDTGPVYGYFRYAYDPVEESPRVIQARVVLENLGAIQKTLGDIVAGQAARLDTSQHASATWGQPWLTKYLGIKTRARRRRRASNRATVS